MIMNVNLNTEDGRAYVYIIKTCERLEGKGDFEAAVELYRWGIERMLGGLRMNDLRRGHGGAFFADAPGA
jgi:hypothetical protein